APAPPDEPVRGRAAGRSGHRYRPGRAARPGRRGHRGGPADRGGAIGAPGPAGARPPADRRGHGAVRASLGAGLDRRRAPGRPSLGHADHPPARRGRRAVADRRAERRFVRNIGSSLGHRWRLSPCFVHTAAESPAGTNGRGIAMPTDDANARGADTLDEATLAELYRLHAGHLRRVLVRITNGDHGKAEDILQETLLRAWRNPHALTRGPAGSRPWLFTVARRIAIDHFRMVGARPQEICDDAPKDRVPTCDPYDAVLAAQDIGVVLDRLPAHH